MSLPSSHFFFLRIHPSSPLFRLFLSLLHFPSYLLISSFYLPSCFHFSSLNIHVFLSFESYSLVFIFFAFHFASFSEQVCVFTLSMWLHDIPLSFTQLHRYTYTRTEPQEEPCVYFACVCCLIWNPSLMCKL